ncbi:hydrocephalus-inducing protein homolog [Archocentrus centrarchus]|uniref:hydrocephalus-inducing protein homolog n=1 Tax=Archocentrus centrarchus TaxID=63155 RepID=UPI0011E9CB81|nr:hydrocephalus-inducing protein homolog [Archocentrus centrarchus]
MLVTSVPETVKPDEPDATVSLKGIKFIDVPAHAQRDYEMSSFTYTEGRYNIQVTFRNDETGEYLFYLITFKATSPGVLSTIELVTPVRRVDTATAEAKNPLTQAACLTTECKCRDIIVQPQRIVPGQSKVDNERFVLSLSSKTDCPDFNVDKSVGAFPGFPVGSKASVEVRLEK